MNTEPVRTNGRIVAAIVAAVAASSVALEAALVALLLALGVEPSLTEALGQITQVIITIVGSTIAILKGAEATREHTTAWDPEIGAVTPAPSEPVDDVGTGIG